MTIPRCEECSATLSFDCQYVVYICNGAGRHFMKYARFNELRGGPFAKLADPANEPNIPDLRKRSRVVLRNGEPYRLANLSPA
jgi:hypothetical protein